MKRNLRIKRQMFIAVALAVFTVAALAVPSIIGTWDRQALIRGVAVLAAGSDRFVLSEPVAMTSSPGITLASGTVFLHTVDNESASSSKFEAKLLESGRAHLAVEDGVVRVDLSTISPSGVLSHDAGRVFAPLLKALVSHHFEALSLRDCTIFVDVKNRASYRFDNVQLDIKLEKGAGVKANGKFDFRGESLSITSGIGVGVLVQDTKRFAIRTKISGRFINARIDGHFVAGAHPQITAQRAQLRFSELGSAARWFGFRWPSGLEAGEFLAQGQLDWTGQSIAIQSAEIQLGENQASGTLSLNFQSDRPLFEGTLAAGALDFSGYFGAVQTSALSTLLKPDNWNAGVWRPESWLAHLGLSKNVGMVPVLREVDADLRVSAERVMGAGFEMGRSAATFSLRSGKLLADLAEFEMPSGGTGNIQTSLDVNKSAPQIGVRGRLKDIEVSHVMKLAFGAPVLSGLGSVALDVRGEGINQFQFFKTLNGKVAVNVPGLSVLALDVKKLVSRNLDSVAADAGWGTAVGRMSLHNVSAKLSFVDGIAHTEDVSGIAGVKVISAEGEIEFPAKALDLKISVSDHVPGTSPSAAPRAGGKVLHVTGHWSKPNVVSPEHADSTTAPVPPADGVPPERPRGG